MKIILKFDPPPIGTRTHDWRATLDGYEPGDPIGYGQTPEGALAELMCLIEDRRQAYVDAMHRDACDRRRGFAAE